MVTFPRFNEMLTFIKLLLFSYFVAVTFTLKFKVNVLMVLIWEIVKCVMSD